jgi:hypothetical protein
MLYSVELQGQFPLFGNANIGKTFLSANNHSLPLEKILTLPQYDYFYRMTKYALLVLALMLMSMPVLAQDAADQNTTQQRQTFQPNVRGSFLVAVGLNGFLNEPTQFEIRNFRSKSVNLYYLYDIPLGDSRFSFHPGVGLGLEKYELKNLVTPRFVEDQAGGTAAQPVLIMDSLQFAYGSGLYQKNRLAANYVDIPLEFTWASNRTNPKAGFKATIGGKVGVLFGSHMKIKYDVGDDTRKLKMKRDWNLNPFRYAAVARVGYSAFNLYVEYQFSQLFDAGDGPLHRATRNTDTTQAPFQAFPTDMANWRVGLAIDLF